MSHLEQSLISDCESFDVYPLITVLHLWKRVIRPSVLEYEGRYDSNGFLGAGNLCFLFILTRGLTYLVDIELQNCSEGTGSSISVEVLLEHPVRFNLELVKG